MHDTTLDHLFAKYNYGVVETDCPFLDIYLHTKDPVCTPVVVIIDAEAAAAVKAADTRKRPYPGRRTIHTERRKYSDDL